MRSVYLLLLMLCLLPLSARSVPPLEDAGMRFSILDTCQYLPGDTNCQPVVVARGTIEQETPATFSKFVATHSAQIHPGTRVYMGSVGGHVIASMRLGLAIRKMGLDTVVATEMRCLSACVYTFLGGVRRLVDEGAVVAVHRFRSEAGPDGNLDDSQRVFALISDYASVMGARPDFMRAVSQGSTTRMVRLDKPLAERLGVDNNAPAPSEWVIKPSEKGLDLVVEQQSLGSDRQAVFAIGRRAGLGLAALIYQEPAEYAPMRTSQDQSGTPVLMICRTPASRRVDPDRCVRGVAATPWSPVGTGRFSVAFGVEIGDLVDRLGHGSEEDWVIVSVGAPEASRMVVLLPTRARGFTAALRSLRHTP